MSELVARWDVLTEQWVSTRPSSATETEKLDDIAASIARLGEALADARAYKPCEPCLRDDHDNCTGDCSSMCCALAAAERERDSALADLAALRGRVEAAVKELKRPYNGVYGFLNIVDAMVERKDAALAILSPPEAPTDKGETP